MFIDSTQLPFDTETDVCIIGTGPAGLTVARSLPAKREIWLLEGGPADQTHASESLYRGENIGLPYFDLDRCRSRQFGGSANCWGGFCRAFDEHDFDERPRIPYSGWPLRWADVLEFYEGAHTLCGLGPVDYTYDAWAAASGQPPSAFTAAHVRPEIRQRSQFDVERLRREVAASSNVHVCLNANVVEIVTSDDGRAVTSVVVREPGGGTHLVRAKLFVLAAGGIENARLLLASRRVQKNGLGNDHDLVGRFFMEHIDFEPGYFHPARPDLFRHQQEWLRAGSIEIRNGLAIAAPIRRREQLLRCFFHIGDLSVEHTFGYQSAGHILGCLARGQAVHNWRYHWRNLVWDRVPLLAAAQWRLHLRRSIPPATGRRGVWRLRTTAEPSPNPASRILLSRARDRFGMPRVALDWRINAEDYIHVQRSLELFAHDVEQLGLGRVQVKPPSEWPTRGTYHHMGTTRMHADEKRGVVDAECRVHGVSNLYVAGSSVFPTAGSGTPTLMIFALALRLARHVAGRLERECLATVSAAPCT
jgi:choline dehydrogenase-like flavoprotein